MKQALREDSKKIESEICKINRRTHFKGFQRVSISSFKRLLFDYERCTKEAIKREDYKEAESIEQAVKELSP